MSTPPSLSSLRTSDRLTIASPLSTPTSASLRNAPPALVSSAHRCSIGSCSLSTTAPPIPLPFLPLAILCFPTSTSSKTFSDKSPVWLCQSHRQRLEEYRCLAVGHAEQSLTAWNDMEDVDGARHAPAHVKEEAHVYVLDDDESSRLLIGAPLIHQQAAAFSCPTYSTFPSVSAATSAFASSELCDDGKPPLSLPVRAALAGGWMCAVSFLALWTGYTVLSFAHHGGK